MGSRDDKSDKLAASEETALAVRRGLSPDGRCTARSKQTGERCRQPAIPGGAVCRFHGGSAPQVRAAAERRLREAEGALYERLLPLSMERAEQLLAEGRNEAAVQSMIGRVWDRVGLGEDQAEEETEIRELLIRVRERVRRP